MRLHVEILRNTLPPVSIIFNTSSNPAPVTTIADFLTAIDRVVPLESADGEWGLEDYVVTLGSAAHGSSAYECLHFQLVADVLKDDDVVTVRTLVTEEVKQRKQGGREQILPDGRHLIDGVAWGKRYNPSVNRPGVVIPPRKRRRLLLDAEDDAELDIGSGEDDEDEDDDWMEDDCNSGGDSDDSEDTSDIDHEQYEGTHRQVIARQSFINIDAESESEDELENLSKEATEYENGDDHPSSLHQTTSSILRKRKRHHLDESGSSSQKQPSRRSMANDIHQSTINGSISKRNKDQITVNATCNHKNQSFQKKVAFTKQVVNTDDASHDSSSDSESVAESIGSPTDSSSDSSSEDDSSSESEASSSSGSSESESDSDLDSSSDSDLGSEVDSDSDLESDSVGDTDTHKSTTDKSLKSTMPQQLSQQTQQAVVKHVDSAPGTGTKRTKANNKRIQRRKHLNRLKEQGLLPPEADFRALDTFELNNNSSLDNETTPAMAFELAQRKEAMLARLGALYEKDDNNDALADKNSVPVVDPMPQESGNVADIVDVSADSAQTPVTVSPARRMRLDIASSRRMLFSSLGVRNPKTAAEEEALREQLSTSTRNIVNKESVIMSPIDPASLHDAGWKNKLTISAVECVQEGLLLTPPPFPFKQRWVKGVQQSKPRLPQRYSDKHTGGNEDVDLNYDDPGKDEAPLYDRSSSYQIPDESAFDYRPYPTSFASLPELTQHAIRAGNVIAYKHLEINVSGEPEASRHKVARIDSVDNDSIFVTLCQSDRDRPSAKSHDDFGVEMYTEHATPSKNDNIVDDGFREISFYTMIEPKLLKSADVHILESSEEQPPFTASTSLLDDSAVIPESVIANQSEIIRSPLELSEDMLQPINLDGSYAAIAQVPFESFMDSASIGDFPLTETTHTRQNIRSSTLGAEEAEMLQSSTGFIPASVAANGEVIRMETIAEEIEEPAVSLSESRDAYASSHDYSSSYQDAQQVPHDSTDIENSNMSHLLVESDQGSSAYNSKFGITGLAGFLSELRNQSGSGSNSAAGSSRPKAFPNSQVGRDDGHRHNPFTSSSHLQQFNSPASYSAAPTDESMSSNENAIRNNALSGGKKKNKKAKAADNQASVPEIGENLKGVFAGIGSQRASPVKRSWFD